MLDFPVKILIVGYGLAAGAAIAAHGALGPVSAGLVFWLGGAVAVVALAVVPGLNRMFLRPEDETADAEDRALEAQMRRWEADRLSDSAAEHEGERAAR